MPSGPRIRGNNAFGVTTDDPLTAGAASFNSAQLVFLPTVASAHAVITLDPLRQFGDPEIVIATAHTAASTVATITRGAYGTLARSHPVGTKWVHAAIDEDYTAIVTSGTRPSNPYEGQFIYETDTNKLVGFGGVDWAPRDAGGQIGYAGVTANQTGITTTEVDLTGLSVAVTVGTGRRIKITGFGGMICDTVDARAFIRINEGANELQIACDTIRITGGSVSATCIPIVVLSPSAGAHTYKLTGQFSAGTGALNASTARPAFILVEDIGAA